MRTKLAARAIWLLITLAAVLATAACGTGPGDSTASPAAASGGTTTPGSPSAGSSRDADAAAGTRDQALPGPASTAVRSRTPTGLRPKRISVPAIGVDASIVDLGIADDRSIEVPSDPSNVGWLDTTPAPGQQGPAVVAGHVDSRTGPAVFSGLSTLDVGDEIVVTRRDGSTATFTVDGVRTYPQDDFPTEDVYGPVPGPALRLITCGGDYVGAAGGYQDNVVVYAS